MPHIPSLRNPRRTPELSPKSIWRSESRSVLVRQRFGPSTRKGLRGFPGSRLSGSITQAPTLETKTSKSYHFDVLPQPRLSVGALDAEERRAEEERGNREERHGRSGPPGRPRAEPPER